MAISGRAAYPQGGHPLLFPSKTDLGISVVDREIEKIALNRVNGRSCRGSAIAEGVETF